MNIIERLQNPVEGIHLACYGVRMRWDKESREWVVYHPGQCPYYDEMREVIYRGTDEAAATLALSDAGNE